MPLANPVVARLAAGELAELKDTYCGLLLICNWPAAAAVQTKYTQLRDALAAALPAAAYVYPLSTLHCTVCTLRAFPAGALDGVAREKAAGRWRPILDSAKASGAWPSAAFRLRITAPTLEGAAGILRYEDVDGAIEAMRGCLRAAIIEAGGLAAEGGGDRSRAKPPPGSPATDPAPHIPDIVHSTALRWSAEPTEAELEAAHAAFAQAAADWEPIELSIEPREVVAVFEDVPFMHIPVPGPVDDAGSSNVWWRAGA
jgi:hypothetical protein